MVSPRSTVEVSRVDRRSDSLLMKSEMRAVAHQAQLAQPVNHDLLRVLAQQDDVGCRSGDGNGRDAGRRADGNCNQQQMQSGQFSGLGMRQEQMVSIGKKKCNLAIWGAQVTTLDILKASRNLGNKYRRARQMGRNNRKFRERLNMAPQLMR